MEPISQPLLNIRTEYVGEFDGFELLGQQYPKKLRLINGSIAHGSTWNLMEHTNPDGKVVIWYQRENYPDKLRIGNEGETGGLYIDFKEYEDISSDVSVPSDPAGENVCIACE